MSEAKTTTNHNEIQKWVEARGGEPARVKRTGRGGDQGILRIDYPGFSGEETLEHISWDDWFDAFDKNQLAFVYQDKVRTGATSRFSKLVTREGRAGSGANGKSATARRGGASKRTTKKTSARAGSSEGEQRTTRKAPRALAARTSKRPTAKKRGSTASSSTTRSSKKRASSTGRSTGAGRGAGTTQRSTAKRGAAKRGGSKRGGSKKRSAKK